MIDPLNRRISVCFPALIGSPQGYQYQWHMYSKEDWDTVRNLIYAGMYQVVEPPLSKSSPFYKVWVILRTKTGTYSRFGHRWDLFPPVQHNLDEFFKNPNWSYGIWSWASK